ncbi:hypothetical protein ACF3NT_11750 [Naumannella halotolerans]|uniref:hypothetical protein n=1 Tax=Naumannella halotolerans TaxID=993414 RepID=UPI00370D6242
MIAFASVMAAIAVALAGFAAFHSWRELQVSIALLAAMVVYEVALIVQLAVFAGALGTRPVDAVVLISYLVVCVVLPVAALLWGLSDKSRWGTGVVAIGMLAVAVMCVRVGQLWMYAS